jgi:hypothetical protein
MNTQWTRVAVRGGILGLLALALCVGSLVEAGRKSPDPLERALHEKFPEAPTSLDANPESAALILVHTKITKGGAFKVIGAMLERAEDGTFVRASRFDKNLILFHDLPPGRYALRLIKFKQTMVGPYTISVSQEDAPLFDLQAGRLHYLGVVRVRIKTVFNSSIELEYAPSSELEAWNAFESVYGGSAWSDLVRERLGELQQVDQ